MPFFQSPKLLIRMGFTEVTTVLGVIVSVSKYMKSIGVTDGNGNEYEIEYSYGVLKSKENGIVYNSNEARFQDMLCLPVPHDMEENMGLNGEYVVVGKFLARSGPDKDGDYLNTCSLKEFDTARESFKTCLVELQKLNPEFATLLTKKELQIIVIPNDCGCCS
jgi:hypothetical protein